MAVFGIKNAVPKQKKKSRWALKIHVCVKWLRHVVTAAPAILPLFHNIVKPFLAEETRAKIRVLGSEHLNEICSLLSYLLLLNVRQE
jgi:CRAL/TRIO domain